MAKTYVLAGHDHNNAFVDSLAVFRARDDVVVIQPIPGESIADTIRKQGIAAGDTVVVASHGGKGSIDWNQGESVSYETIFKTLPEGLSTIAVTNCFGGSAQDSLAHVPKGAVLQSLVGSETIGVGTAVTQFAREAKAGMSPTDMFLEALDNVDPKEVASVAARENAVSTTPAFVSDPNKVLPHLIGIGGGESINLNDKIAEMGRAADAGTLDRIALDKATQLVFDRFDTARDGRKMEMTGFNWSEFKVTHEYKSAEVNGGKQAEDALREQILGVSIKMQMGVPLEGFEEKRLGYALAAAHMQTSGEMDRLMQQAKMPPTQAPQQAPAQAATAQQPDVASIQNFLNDMGMVGANGKTLTPDGIVGNNTRHAFMKFCEQNDLNPANGVDETFRATMQRYQEAFKSGALTQQEVIDIKETQEVLSDITKGMSPAQLAAIRGEFAEMRAAMMGSGNDTQVKEEIGQLVAITKTALAEQDAARGRV